MCGTADFSWALDWTEPTWLGRDRSSRLPWASRFANCGTARNHTSIIRDVHQDRASSRKGCALAAMVRISNCISGLPFARKEVSASPRQLGRRQLVHGESVQGPTLPSRYETSSLIPLGPSCTRRFTVHHVELVPPSVCCITGWWLMRKSLLHRQLRAPLGFETSSCTGVRRTSSVTASARLLCSR